MGKAQFEGEIGDAFPAGGIAEPRIEVREPNAEQHLRDRLSEMPLEPELQRPDAGARDLGELREIERISRMRMQIFAGTPQRPRQCFRTAIEHLDGIAEVMTRPVQETAKQGLAQVGGRDGCQAFARSGTLGQIDEIPDLRLKLETDGAGEFDRRFEFDGADRPFPTVPRLVARAAAARSAK